MTSRTGSILDRAPERAAVYELLATLWDHAPGADLLSRISHVPSESETQTWEELKAACDEDSETLAVEYTRLFVGPKDHLPPFQSVWEERQLDGEAATSMRKYGEVLGLKKATDHLAVQLHGMAVVLSEASEVGVENPELQSLASSFFTDHLTWPREFFAAVVRRSHTRFYSALASLTRDFLTGESEF